MAKIVDSLNAEIVLGAAQNAKRKLSSGLSTLYLFIRMLS